jgi:two-component system NtrC family response regulator
MKPPLQLLIVSSRIEAKKALLHIVEGLPVNAYTSPTIERAWEVLMDHPIDVIFCDERLPDGAYPDFLSAVRSDHKTTQFIVLLSSEEWEDYLQAMRLGVTDVLRGSFQPTDVELLLIRASRGIGQREEFHLSATA